MLVQQHYYAALYMRLSKDDEGKAESASISTQRKMLRAYADKNGFSVYDEYIDDGFSGTTFERPAFKRMLCDIEERKINLVITKDLSRLGRDYIAVGKYIEIIFPSNQVRYIAINDGYDSESLYDSDIAPFKNVVNEMYARDTSRKIRSAQSSLMEAGAFIAPFAPYGYQRDPSDKHHLIKNLEVAEYLNELYDRALSSESLDDIADNFNLRGIMTPSQYRKKKYNMSSNYPVAIEWTAGGIRKLLKNKTNLGYTVQGKTTKASLKSHAVIYIPESEQHTNKNMHEAYITEQQYDTLTQIFESRTCHKKNGFQNIFSGIAKCADCGKGMSTVGTRKKGSRANLACGAYKLRGSSACSNHFIDYEILYKIVLDTINEIAKAAMVEESKVITTVEQKLKKEDDNVKIKKDIIALKKRNREIDFMIERVYEDYTKKVISPDRKEKLLKKYEEESKSNNNKILCLSKRKETESSKELRSRLKAMFHDCVSPTELNSSLLHRLISRIDVYQGEYIKTEKGKVKHQTIKIYFKFSGKPVEKTYTL